MKKLSTLVLALLLALSTLSITGCNEADKGGNTAQAPTTTEKPAEPEEVEANWTINVADKQTIDSQGLPIDYTLKFTATKAGGTDPTGTYKGSAHLKVKADFSKVKGIPQNVIKVMGGVDGKGDAKDFTFKVTTFEDAKKAAASNSKSDPSFTPATLVPPKKDANKDDKTSTSNTLPKPTEEDKAVANPDFYSFGYMTMTGMGKLNIEAKAIGGEQAKYSDQKSSSDNIAFSMNIVGATVYIDIPNVGRFKGTVTGDPIQ